MTAASLRSRAFLWCSLLVSSYWCFADGSGSTYVGAVAQHSTFVAAGMSPTELLAENLKLYEGLAAMAARNGVQILVFPEFGLTAVSDTSRASLYPFAQPLPEADGTIVPCSDAAFQSTDNTILRTVSCMASLNKIALLVNTIDSIACDKAANKDCPADGRFLYNTDMVLDETGALVAKYHKSHEWPTLKPPYDQAPEPSQVTFKPSWGPEFGIFTCFDIAFSNPAVELARQGVSHFLYPVAQGNIGKHTIQPAWSWRYGATLLASNLGKDCSSVLQAGKQLPTKQLYLRDENGSSAASSDDSILISNISY